MMMTPTSKMKNERSSIKLTPGKNQLTMKRKPVIEISEPHPMK